MSVSQVKHVEVLKEFLRSELGLNPDEYDFEREGVDATFGWEIIQAWHAEDREQRATLAPGTGSGKSQTLYVDPSTGEVKQALKWQ